MYNKKENHKYNKIMANGDEPKATPCSTIGLRYFLEAITAWMLFQTRDIMSVRGEVCISNKFD